MVIPCMTWTKYRRTRTRPLFFRCNRCVECTKESKRKQTQCFPSQTSCKECIQGKTTFKNIRYCQIHGWRQPILSKKQKIHFINTHLFKLLKDDALSWYFDILNDVVEKTRPKNKTKNKTNISNILSSKSVILLSIRGTVLNRFFAKVAII